MYNFLGLFVISFMSFLAIMNPFANLPIFLALTDQSTNQQRRNIAKKTLIITFCLISLFAVLGKYIFDAFSISLPALRVTGGILIFVIGFHMLQGKTSEITHSINQSGHCTSTKNMNEVDQMSIAISPLAIPILGGPGTIATAMNFSAKNGWLGMIATIISFAVLCVIVFLVFIYGTRILQLLGPSLMTIISRVMGLILAGIGVQMVFSGICTAFPILARGS